MSVANEPDSAMHDWMGKRLFARRVVMLSGQIDTEVANLAAGQLMLLDTEGDDPVEVHLTDAGGEVDAILTLLDVVDAMGIPVHVSVAGAVRGPAVALLAAGTRRVLRTHATIELTEPRIEVAEGRASELAALVAEHTRRLRRLQERIAQTCGKDPDEVAADMRTGKFLDADAARAYGLAD